MMNKNFTRLYMDEILGIYRNICTLRLNNIQRLKEQKNRFIRLYTKIQDNKILSDNILLEELELKFLSTTREKEFLSEANNLERIVLEYFFSIYGSVTNKPVFDKYYRSIFFYYHNKFIKNITKKDYLEVNRPDNNSIERVDLNNLIDKYRKSYSSAKANFPKERKLKIIEIKNIEKVLLPIFVNYKNTIEGNFFEIKEYFAWYDKDIRIYISNIYGDVFIIAYPSHHLKVSIYPLLISTYSVGCNFEELPYKKQAYFMIGFHKTGKKLINSPGLIARRIDINPFEEVLDIFWFNSGYEEKRILLKDILHLLGFSIIQIKLNKEFYYLNKISINLTNPLILEEDKKPILIAIPNKSWLNDDDAIKLITAFDEIIKTKELNKIIFARADSSSEKLLKNRSIRIIPLSTLIELLLKLNQFKFIKPFLIETIQKKDNHIIHDSYAIREEGNTLLRKIRSFGGKNWKTFELLMEDAFKFLFKASFKNYYAERQYIEDGGHRKIDFVISNINPIHEFWKNRKTEEKAKRIVVDCKNYNRKITSDTIHDVSKYLHPKKGNFAIIITTEGLDKSAILEQKNKYFHQDQLIIVLNRNDIIEMINYKINRQEPEEILERRISILL